MRHLFLLHLLTALVLVAWASPLPAPTRSDYQSPDRNVAAYHPRLEPDLARRQTSEDTDALDSNVYDLAPHILAFDMATYVTMFGPPANGTNVPSEASLRRANFPDDLTLEPGAFTTVVDPDLFKVRDVDKFISAKGLLRSAAYAKMQTLDRHISGEADLTQLMVQGLAMPVTEVLRAIVNDPSTKVHWHGEGRGSAPIPDMVFEYVGVGDVGGGVDGESDGANSNRIIVMEIKTIDSMPNAVFDNIVSNLPLYYAEPQSSPNGTFYSLRLKQEAPLPATKRTEERPKKRPKLNKATKPKAPPKRTKDAIILEQALSQIFSSPKVTIGILTNLENWLVFERKGNTIRVTLIPGVKPNGQNNGFDIMLAASLAAMTSSGIIELHP